MGEAGPSPSGFKNLEPMSREERLAVRNKDAIEQRIAARQHGAGPLHQRLPPVTNPLAPVKNSSLYIEEHERFKRDVAGEFHKEKMEAIHRREEQYERKRAEQYHREKHRWDSQATVEQRHESKLQQLREQGLGARRNRGSTAYNLLTLDYDSTPQGQALAAKDDLTRAKAQQRAINLYSKNHSVSHNIITGQLLAPINPGKYQTVAPWDK